MSIISNHKNKITLLYNSETSLGKQTFAYAQNARMKVLAIDTAKTKITGTQWYEIILNLGLDFSELVNTKHPNFTNLFKEDIQLNQDDWLKVIEKHPQVITTPIFINDKVYKVITTPSQILQYLNPDSKGISR